MDVRFHGFSSCSGNDINVPRHILHLIDLGRVFIEFVPTCEERAQGTNHCGIVVELESNRSIRLSKLRRTVRTIVDHQGVNCLTMGNRRLGS